MPHYLRIVAIASLPSLFLAWHKLPAPLSNHAAALDLLPFPSPLDLIRRPPVDRPDVVPEMVQVLKLYLHLGQLTPYQLATRSACSRSSS